MLGLLRKSSLITVLALTIALGTGCSKQQKGDDLVSPDSISADENAMGDSDSGRAMGLETVFFDYDSFVLSGSTKVALDKNVGVLKSNSNIKIQIEGHCDQRGGVEYNVALGEKRANAVKRYFEDRGVAAKRLTTISYGKERLMDPRETEEAYSKNRRANFVITEK